MRALVISCTAPGSIAIASDEVLASELTPHGIDFMSVSLLTDQEATQFRADADFMAERMQGVIASAPNIPLGLIGYGTTAAAAIIFAAQNPGRIGALVSVNGRTDIAVDSLRALHTPTLLLVNDMPVLRVNREAVSLIKAERRIEIVHGAGEQATHAMAEKTVRWLADRLVPVEVAV
jgi:putative phosphoribosyl transferase